MKAAWTFVPQASITLSAWVCFGVGWKRAAERLYDRGERIVGTKSRKRLAAVSVLRADDNLDPNDRRGGVGNERCGGFPKHRSPIHVG